MIHVRRIPGILGETPNPMLHLAQQEPPRRLARDELPAPEARQRPAHPPVVARVGALVAATVEADVGLAVVRGGEGGGEEEVDLVVFVVVVRVLAWWGGRGFEVDELARGEPVEEAGHGADVGGEGGAGVVGRGVFEGAVEEGEGVDGAVGVAGWGGGG